MSLGVIEKNLMILLDPGCRTDGTGWCFAPWRSAAHLAKGEGRTVYSFRKKELLPYLRFLWRAGRSRQGRCRTFLYLNDGLLSALFEGKNSGAYRAFAASHLPPRRGGRQRLVALLPPVVRAEMRFVVLEPSTPCQEAPPPLQGQEFMFFSNPGGKLLVTSVQTLRTGAGGVYKTTASPSYAEVMEQEFTTMRAVAAVQGEPPNLPRVGARLRAGERVFYGEEYLSGKSLRDRIHALSHAGDAAALCALLDRLDGWFERYRSSFTVERRPLCSCYEHLFTAFAALYGEHPAAPTLLARGRRTLAHAAAGASVIPVTAHNDLWPGNFVVGEGGLVAIDWERSAVNRAPLFDYYWMIVSAALEHLICRIGRVEYGRAFRLFRAGEDEVARHAAAALPAFLERLGVERALEQDFLFLFLMEWSVQGYLALGSQTAMDRLAFTELLAFAESVPSGGVAVNSSLSPPEGCAVPSVL